MSAEGIAPDELGALGARLRDPVWRLHHLYWIKDALGKAIEFRPNAAQRQIIAAVYEQRLRKILIPKARQLGMSTVIALIMLDMMLFGSGVQGAVIDQTQSDATKKLKGKIIFAFSRLPRALRDKFAVLKSNDHTLSVKLREQDADTASEVQAGMNARGDTFQILHISEWGPIAFNDPPRSEEIFTGAMPAAKLGIIIVETTWKGGKVGHLWDLTKNALEISDRDRTAEDFTVFFFPWWGDQDYSLEGDGRQITAECRKYLEETEAEIEGERRRENVERRTSNAERRSGEGGVASNKTFAFTAGQRLWYYKIAWAMGLFRFQEYPSMLSECFRAPIEGAIYAEHLDKLRASGAIGLIEPDPSALVGTCWDRGSPMNMVTWYFQLIGEEIRVIDCDMDLDITSGERVERMRMKEFPNGQRYQYGFHFLPHDALATDKGGRTFQAEFEAAGLVNTRIVPRTDDVWIGINRVRQMMPRMTFRTPACDKGLNSLEAYRQGIWNDGKRAVDVPVHDKASHASDALRVIAEADLAGMLDAGWVKSAFSSAGLKALRGKTSNIER